MEIKLAKFLTFVTTKDFKIEGFEQPSFEDIELHIKLNKDNFMYVKTVFNNENFFTANV